MAARHRGARPLRRTCRDAGAALAAAALLACSPAPDPIAAEELCTGATRVATLPPELDEASGVTLSRRHEGVLWVHNDSEGAPSLYALDTNGRLLVQVELPAAGHQSDWEAISSGPCPAGDCLYIGDIGDNLHDRDDRAILRIAEPELVPRPSAPVERFQIAYPDGPRDAEALFVLPDTTIFIISKGRDGPITVYRYPPPLRPGERVTLERIQQLSEGIAQLPYLVTGAAATPDGSAVVVRTYARLQLFRFAADTLQAVWPAPGFDLGPLAEPQGEGVTIAADGTVHLVSEVGPERRPAPLSRVVCTIP